MNDLVVLNNKDNEVTMTTIEIAELTGKEHRNVLADTRKMLEELGISLLTFKESYTNSRGREYNCYRLPKRETLILVSGYSLKLRAAIIDRVEQLEKALRNIQHALPNFNNPVEAARAWADQCEQKQIALERVEKAKKVFKRQRGIIRMQSHKINQDKPKVEAFNEPSK